MAVGIQGCDDMFIDPETGLCDPSLVDCPLGHIPIFGGDDQGCRSVGIQGCEAMFMDPETGMCDPAYLECPPGQIPVFGGDDQGCRAIGIVDCHQDFFDAVTGRCDPKPDACPEGSMPIPTQGCVSLDPPGGCGEGPWGNIEELPGDVHLDVGYTSGDSDGSREKPWTLYAYAIGEVQAGGRIVFAAGNYDEGILVSKSISLVGRCSSMVTLSGVREGPLGPTVLEVKGDVEVSISDLRVSGHGIGILAHAASQLSVSRASLKDNHSAGLVGHGSGTILTASEVWVSGTQLDGEGLRGYGVNAQSGASVSVSRSRVSGNHSSGLRASGSGTTLTASELWVSGTKVNAEGLRGFGVVAQSGASASVSRSRVSDNHTTGVWASGLGTSLTASEVWVSGTQVNGEGEHGGGVFANAGANVTVNRSFVSDNPSGGIRAVDSGTNLTASEVWVSGTQVNGEGPNRFGVNADFGSSVTVNRSRVSDNHGAGVLAHGAGTNLIASEVWVSGTQVNGQGFNGAGVISALRANVTVNRSLVSDNHSSGLIALDLGSILTANEVWVSGTQMNGEGLNGYGVNAQWGSIVSVSRSRVSDHHSAGLIAFDLGTIFTATEVWVSGTQPDSAGVFGAGVVAVLEASLNLSHSRVSDNHSAGLVGYGSGTTLTATEVWVSDTKTDDMGLFGVGVIADLGASVSVRRSYVSDNYTAGIFFVTAVGSVRESLLEGTKPGGNQLADGVLIDRSVVSVQSVISRDNVRAGVLFDKSDGEITDCLITQNAIGLANQGQPGATLADDNVIGGNDQDRLDDGALAVPDKAMELPSWSGSE
jgi:hypothetical protein